MIRLSDHIMAAGGWLSIEQFMKLALYDPEEGYYSASIQNVGVRGDFSTSATMSPLLARGIRRAWEHACEQSGSWLPVIEIGGGNATLALAFMHSFGFWKRRKVHYHIVETSPPLRNLQHLALGGFAKIHRSMESALKSCKGKAFIFSNELVDAFPARVFEQTEEGWKEVGLAVKAGELVEELRPIEKPPVSSALECSTDTGQRVEVHQAYRDWFINWLPLWKSGIMTTIDYGAELQQLYYRKPKGTLRAYRHHRMFTGMDIYDSPGKRDLTCDVNFTDLKRMADDCLGDNITLTTQREYLLPCVSGTSEDAYLTQENGPGDHFKVLIQERFK